MLAQAMMHTYTRVGPARAARARRVSSCHFSGIDRGQVAAKAAASDGVTAGQKERGHASPGVQGWKGEWWRSSSTVPQPVPAPLMLPCVGSW
jgi:hypothetical protein